MQMVYLRLANITYDSLLAINGAPLQRPPQTSPFEAYHAQ